MEPSEEFEVDECHQQKCGKHSQKPHHFRELINKAVQVSFQPPVKLELFARSRKGMFSDYEYEEGWDVWGNSVNNSIDLTKNPLNETQTTADLFGSLP